MGEGIAVSQPWGVVAEQLRGRRWRKRAVNSARQLPVDTLGDLAGRARSFPTNYC